MKQQRSKNLFLIFFTSFILAFFAFAYDTENIHPNMSSTAAAVFNKIVPILTNEQIGWIRQGSIDEDGSFRFTNHFYNPQTGQGLDYVFDNKPCKGLPTKKWAQDQSVYYSPGYGWSSVSTLISADFSESAIFTDYQNGNQERAWQGVGHIMHLIQDMAVPAHVRNDGHGPGDDEPYEIWSKKFGQVSDQGVPTITISSLDEAFDGLAGYTHDNFYSKDSVGMNDIPLGDIKKEIGESGEDVLYAYKDGFRLVQIKEESISRKFIFDNKVNEDYFKQLSPRAIGYSVAVIKYFSDQFKQIDQKKEEEAKQLSFFGSVWQKVKSSSSFAANYVDYMFSDGFTALTFAGEKALDSFSNSSTSGQAAEQTSSSQQEIQTSIAIEAVQSTSSSETHLAIDTAIKGIKIVSDTASKTLAIAKDVIENPLTIKDVLGVIPTLSKGADTSDEVAADLPSVDDAVDDQAGSDSGPIADNTANSTPTFISSHSTIVPPDTFIMSSPGTISSTSLASFSFSSSKTDSVFECDLNHSGWQSCQTDESWSVPDGANGLAVRSLSSGIYDETPAVFSWQVDTAAPVITLSSFPSALASSSLADFTIATETDTTYYQSLDGASSSPASSTISFSGLADGAHQLDLAAIDIAGNVGTTSFSWTIDTTVPTSSIVNLDPLYDDTGFTVSWEGSESGMSYDIGYAIGSGAMTAWLVGTTSTSSVFTEALSPGQSAAFRVRAIDTAGNRGEWSATATAAVRAPVGAVVDLQIEHIYTSASSMRLLWSAPTGANVAAGARYDLRYTVKTISCSLTIDWDSAFALGSSSLPVPSTSAGTAQEADIAGLAANTAYCFALKTYNGQSWSDLSNQADNRTIPSQTRLTNIAHDWAWKLTTQTLTPDKNPYYLDYYAELPAGRVITIMPGVVVKFGPAYMSGGTTVYPGIHTSSDGGIIADGTAENPIVFTTIYDDVFCGDSGNDGATSGSWGGVDIGSNNLFDHTIWRFGGGDRQLIRMTAEGNRITNSLFENDYRGVYIQLSAVTSQSEIDHNIFRNFGVQSPPLTIHDSASPVITHNDIYGNAAGGIAITDAAAPVIRYNNIYNNSAAGVFTNQYYTPAADIDARYNWWGSASGPTNAANPGGTGDVVAGKIDFSEWSGERN